MIPVLSGMQKYRGNVRSSTSKKRRMSLCHRGLDYKNVYLFLGHSLRFCTEGQHRRSPSSIRRKKSSRYIVEEKVFPLILVLSFSSDGRFQTELRRKKCKKHTQKKIALQLNTNNEYGIFSCRRNKHKVGRWRKGSSGRANKLWTLPKGNHEALWRLPHTLLLLEEVLEGGVAEAQSRVQAVSTCSTDARRDGCNAQGSKPL